MSTQAINNHFSLNLISPIAVDNQSSVPVTANELSTHIENILFDGIKNKWDSTYTAHQISESLKHSPEAAKELKLCISEVDIKTKIVDPFREIISNTAQKNNRIIFLGIGPSAFVGSITPGTTIQKGYGITGTLIGIAFDTKSKELKLYRSGGEVTPNSGSVGGACIGIGVSVGEVYGNWNDFFGEATEQSGSVVYGATNINEASGAWGWGSSYGKGWGACAATVNTYTTEVNIKP